LGWSAFSGNAPAWEAAGPEFNSSATPPNYYIIII
jgi:hypothetical protein